MTEETWEAAYTRLLVQNLSRIREQVGLTIEQFANGCNAVVGSERFKANTLQALFAGKRKSVSVAELVIFAEVLEVPLVALLLPLAKPDAVVPTFDGGSESTLEFWSGLAKRHFPSESDRSNYLGTLVNQVTKLDELLYSLEATVESYELATRPGARPAISAETLLEQARNELLRVRNLLHSLDQAHISYPKSEDAIAWARAVDPERLDAASMRDLARTFIDTGRVDG